MTLKIGLITQGSPDSLSGGYRYHQRMAEAAGVFHAEIRFTSFPQLPFPLAVAYGNSVASDVGSADAVIIDSIAASYVAPWLGSLGMPLIATCHQLPGGLSRPLRRTLQRRFDLHTYRRCSTVVVSSRLLANQLARHGIDSSKLVVIPPGRDLAVPHTTDLRKDRRTVVLCVANWLPHKRILELVESFKRLFSGDAVLHLVGDRDVDPSYTRKVYKSLDDPFLKTSVVVHGPLGRPDVASLYAGADIFVLVSDWEAYGAVYAEAMSAGLPVIAGKAGNAPYLIEHGREGILVPPLDSDSLTDALSALINDLDQRARMGRAAKARADQEFPTWEESSAAFFDVIHRHVDPSAMVR